MEKDTLLHHHVQARAKWCTSTQCRRIVAAFASDMSSDVEMAADGSSGDVRADSDAPRLGSDGSRIDVVVSSADVVNGDQTVDDDAAAATDVAAAASVPIATAAPTAAEETEHASPAAPANDDARADDVHVDVASPRSAGTGSGDASDSGSVHGETGQLIAASDASKVLQLAEPTPEGPGVDNQPRMRKGYAVCVGRRCRWHRAMTPCCVAG